MNKNEYEQILNDSKVNLSKSIIQNILSDNMIHDLSMIKSSEQNDDVSIKNKIMGNEIF